MLQSNVARDYTNEDAAYGLRFALGCAMELTIAVWLLTRGDFRPFSTWLAYLLLVQTGVVVLFGLWWYGCWAHERRATPWYLASVISLIGITCLALDKMFTLNFDAWTILLSLSILYFAAGYGLWRLAKFVTIQVFSILLIAVSQVGAAWRGEIR